MQPLDSSIKIEHISDCFEEGGQKTDRHDAMFDHFRMAVSRGLLELIEKQKSLGCPVKLIAYDSFLPWVLDTVHQLGLYGAAFFTQSYAVCTIYYHEHQGSLHIHPSEGSTEISNTLDSWAGTKTVVDCFNFPTATTTRASFVGQPMHFEAYREAMMNAFPEKPSFQLYKSIYISPTNDGVGRTVAIFGLCAPHHTRNG
ncbi:hypothetical protein RJ640_027480 [Escallonia rubra]|uniref:Uncharacterized protein n=1 Tax=Escallonia rubra TaxID=112253 RepID=A0AA88U4Q9_9ASTE|nr:hypothetical protein RJ640_027480 [Escallonia rubra]